MPASIAHMLIAGQARNRLLKDENPEVAKFAADVLEKHLHYMALGSLGPDLPYFNLWSLWNPHRPIGVDQWSYQLHCRNPNVFPLRMIELVWRESDPREDVWSEGDKCKFAFACGFLTHVAADQIIHPLVNLIAGPYAHSHKARDEHRTCEIHQDLYDLACLKHEGMLSISHFRSEQFHNECDISLDQDVGDLERNEFLYFIQKAFVESHAVMPRKCTLKWRIRFLRWALCVCRYQTWYNAARKNLFNDKGELRQDTEEYRKYILLNSLPGIELFQPNNQYKDFVDDAIEVSVLYIKAAYQLYRAPRLDDGLRNAFSEVVVNADLGSPLQLHIRETATAALPLLENQVDDRWKQYCQG